MNYGLNATANMAAGCPVPANAAEQAEIAIQHERYAAEMKMRELMDRHERGRMAALQAALQCYPGVGDHQKVLLAAKEFALFLQAEE